MVSEGEIWTLERDLCRCCHAEGSFDNLATPQSFMDQEEIYSDMLRHCFDIDITLVPGALCAVTYTICPSCVLKLRDASAFKKQVQLCEEKFLELYYKKAITVKGQIAESEANVKDEPEIFYPTEYQVEFSPDEDDDMDSDGKFELHDPELDQSDDEICEEKLKKEVTLKKAVKLKKEIKLRKEIIKREPKTKARAKTQKREEKTQKGEEKAQNKEEKKNEGSSSVKFLRIEENGEKVWQCVDCGRNFKKRDLFAQHYKFVHLKLRPKLRSCNLCTEKVPTQYRPFHMEQAHGLPAPSCGACGKKFAFPNQVLRHQKAYHMGEKQFTCTICDMKFASNALLLSHSIKHTPLRPYKCSYCEKSFRWKKNLKTHVHMHLDVRNYACRICDESFVQQSSLKYHMTKRHYDAM